jgi:hypothetical protein
MAYQTISHHTLKMDQLKEFMNKAFGNNRLSDDEQRSNNPHAHSAVVSSMSTGNDNGKSGTPSLDDMVMHSAGRDFAKQYGGDDHGDWLNQQSRLVGPPSTKVNLPNGDIFDTVSLTSKAGHRIATNSLHASVVAMSSQSSKRPRLYPDPSPAPSRSRHQIPASVSGLARPQFPDFVLGSPAAAAEVTPSAASKSVYDLSHDYQ